MNLNIEIGRLLDLSQAEIGTYTASQLRRYIREALKVVNDMDYMYGEDLDIEDTYEMLEENLGTYHGKIVGRTSNAKKTELFDKAMDLKIHMKSLADYYVPEDAQLNDRARKTYEKVKERWGDDDFSEEQFNKVAEMFGYFGQEVLEKYIDSDQIYSTYSEVFEEYGERTANSLFDIMKYEYHTMMKDKSINGLDKRRFSEIFSERVMSRLKEY